MAKIDDEKGFLGLYFDINEDKYNELLNNLFNEEDLYTEEEGFGLEPNPHITILYGFTEDVTLDHIKEEIQDKVIINDDIELSGLSLFENEKYDVIKIDIKSDKLHAFNSDFDQLPNTNQFPDYIPHITLAYVKKGMGKKYISGMSGKDIMITIKEMLNYTDLFYKARVEGKDSFFSILCG